MASTAKETMQIVVAKRQEYAALLDQYKTDQIDLRTGAPVYDYPSEVMQELQKRELDISDLTSEYTSQANLERVQKNEAELAKLSDINYKYRMTDGGGSGVTISANRENRNSGQQKSLGELVTESMRYKLRADTKGRFSVELKDIDFKTLMTTAGTPGYTPANPRTNVVVPYPTRPLRVVDLITVTPTDLSSVKWMEETTFNNNASMTGEGYTKVESDLDWTERTSEVRKIATWMQITNEQMDDVPGFMSLIDNRLRLMLGLKEEQQILLGSGVGQEIVGLLTHGSLQTQAFSVNNADTILKAMTKVQWTGYGVVTGIVMHPTNWETIRLIKGATNQDYVLGSPLIDVQPRLWGVPVVITNAITVGTALVGDFAMFAEIRRKSDMSIDVTDAHSSFFIENKLAIRAEMREALLNYRGSAFCSATSLT